jgi:UDP-N-acetylmuramoyl-tripeptide--D-alanyl-D-alanine ligase
MIPLTLAQIADVVGGDLLDPSAAQLQVDGVTIDSRTARAGMLFVALPGTRTDGHRFVDAAVAAGATAALVSADRATEVLGRGPAEAPPPVSWPAEPVRRAFRGTGPREVPRDATSSAAPLIAVDDPADALLGLGVWVRDMVDPLVIGITGSNGKTTTKDLIAAAGRSRRTVANQGSFNNELGVPLTCCRLEADTEVLVCEVGMRGRGQIAQLAGLLRPTVGVVTSVAEVHLELLGSLQAIAAAKGELVEVLPPDGVAVLSADDPLVAAMATTTDARVVTFGQSASADWRARDVVLDDAARATFALDSPYGGARVRVPVPGLHNVGNALAALAATVESGVALTEAVAGLEQATVSRWRLQLERIAGVRVLNDAYNANPTSMAAALRTLARMAADGRRWAVLGTMAEIGPTSEREHRGIGTVVAELDIDRLITVGPTAAVIRESADAADPDGAAGRWSVDDVEGAASLLASEVDTDDVVLVKASRSAALEGVVAGLERRLAASAAPGEPRP